MSKHQPAVSLIHVPDRFSIVEPGVYRSASPTALQVRATPLQTRLQRTETRQPIADGQVPFLASLQLRTIVSLTPEFPVRQLVAFTRSAGVDFVSLPKSPPGQRSVGGRDTRG